MESEYKNVKGFNRREFLFLSALGMAGAASAGLPAWGYGADKRPKYGGRLRVGERYGSTGLDVHKNQYFMDYQNYVLMYNGLAIMGPLPATAIYPDLAKSWEISKDGREYTFFLREGVKFHHGKELDSRDVKYSMERVMNPATRSPRASAYRGIDSIRTPDKYQVKIRLKDPFGPFLTTLTIQDCPIIPADWQPTGTKPAPGTGPFVLKSYVPNETTEFDRFDQYWEKDEKTGDRLPYLDGIHVKKIVDDMVRWIALRAGDLDYINSPDRKAVIQEKKKPTPGIVVELANTVGGRWIVFNVTKPPYDNKKVRQAIAYAIDKKEFIEAAHWGLGEPMNQPFSRLSPLHIPVKDREADLAKAKQLLAEAGYPKGFKTEIMTESTTQYVEGSNATVGQLKKIGIEATIKTSDRAAYFTLMRKGEFSIGYRGDSQRLDPDDAYYLWLHSSEIGQSNWSRYSNKEFDQLLEKGRTTWKWEDRVPIYRKVVEIINEDLPLLYLLKPHNPVAWRAYVKGFDAGAATWFGYYGGGFKKTWLDK